MQQALRCFMKKKYFIFVLFCQKKMLIEKYTVEHANLLKCACSDYTTYIKVIWGVCARESESVYCATRIPS